MKKILLISFIFISTLTSAQNFTSFKSAGNFNQYVPVLFRLFGSDGGNKPVNISRHSLHEDQMWLAHGLASITAMGFGWGSGGNSVKLENFTSGHADGNHSNNPISFVGRVVTDWAGNNVVVFLRGGTTYYTDGYVLQNTGAFSDGAGSISYSSVSIIDPLYNLPRGTYYSDTDINAKTAVFCALASGRVGIGTTHPDEKLTVNGTIHATEVKVTTTVPADYVFQKYYTGKSTLKSDYVMPTLAEIESFTKKNHHLPNVPSAQEVEQNGVSLGTMSNVLLQKVEELTLYAIEQNKELERLKKENENYKSLAERLSAIEKELKK
jgi:hypothetical protein